MGLRVRVMVMVMRRGMRIGMPEEGMVAWRMLVLVRHTGARVLARSWELQELAVAAVWRAHIVSGRLRWINLLRRRVRVPPAVLDNRRRAA